VTVDARPLDGALVVLGAAEFVAVVGDGAGRVDPVPPGALDAYGVEVLGSEVGEGGGGFGGSEGELAADPAAQLGGGQAAVPGDDQVHTVVVGGEHDERLRSINAHGILEVMSSRYIYRHRSDANQLQQLVRAVPSQPSSPARPTLEQWATAAC
jgi:hypothetical protein